MIRWSEGGGGDRRDSLGSRLGLHVEGLTVPGPVMTKSPTGSSGREQSVPRGADRSV